jgi:hypothetical protein
MNGTRGTGEVDKGPTGPHSAASVLLTMKRATAALFVAMFAAPVSSFAQPVPLAETQPTTPRSSATSVDAAKMGVSLDRIRRELRQAEVREQSGDDPLKLQFTVEVYGTAPRINLLENFPLTGPVPYGGPTHQDVLDVLTPKEFRSPVVPFSAIAYWAAQQLWNKSKKQRCEEELAEYRRLVMQGVSVAAPRCTQ